MVRDSILFFRADSSRNCNLTKFIILVVDTSSKMLGGDDDVDVDSKNALLLTWRSGGLPNLLSNSTLHVESSMKDIYPDACAPSVLGDEGALGIAKVLWSIDVDIQLHYSHPAELEGP
ncbi:hypothetical protein HDU67_003070, partial [Dinochytrium kinnereticum]